MPWEIFDRQLERWQDFRRWQRDNRWLEDDDDGGFSAYVEDYKRFLKRHYNEKALPKALAEIEADPSFVKGQWDKRQRQRQLQRYYCREFHGGDGFSDYVDAVKRRLARHEFTRTFQLKEDPKRQDKLTTWIEYLNFEYWWLDRYTDAIERLRLDHDKAWQKLVDLKVLRPHETQEFIRTNACSKRDHAERQHAWKAVQRATAKAEQVYTSTQLDSRRLSIPKPERRRSIQAATHELVTAQRLLESVTRHNDLITEFVRGTWGFKDAKKDAARLRILLPWILEQVPLIEAE
jgi:hypothetical protein